MSQRSNEKASSEHSKTLKVTPYKSTGITKTLFTPCRRLGLSRKFKSTPTNNSGFTSTPISSSSPLCDAKSKETPIVALSPKNDEEQSQKQNVGKFKRTPTKNSGLASTPTSSTTLLCDTKSKEKPVVASSPKYDEEQSQKQNIGNSCFQNTESISNCSTVTENKSKKLSDIKERKRNEKKLKNKKVEEKENKSSFSDIVRCEDIRSSEPNKPSSVDTGTNNVVKKKFKRCLSMKKSSSSMDELSDVDLLSTPKASSTTSLLSNEFLKECSVKLENINEDTDEEIKIVVPNKKRCIVYSSDEDDFVPSQNSIKKESSSENNQDDDLVVKVAEIKNVIKKKEARLAELKQAAVYRRLHNVDELGQSVKMWKKCCEEGLIHLLPKLQEHGPMDMLTLMKNLNVPKSIVYDINTESFV